MWLHVTVDAVARAIADPVRRRILEALRDHPLPAGEIAAMFAITRPAVSRHLRVLREGGLVVDRVDGRRRVYALDTGPLGPLVSWIAGLDRASGWERRFDALDTEVRRARRDRLAGKANPAGDTAGTGPNTAGTTVDQEKIA